MELHMTKHRIGLSNTIFDDFDERPVDCECMLPDFLPDIAAVLKCTMRPIVQSYQVNGGRVMADGTVYLQILYLDEERRCVHTLEHAQPFTSAFTVKDLTSSDVITLSATANYVNCRATGPRRLDIHGAFSVKLVVAALQFVDCVESVDCDNVFCKTESVVCTVPCSVTDKTFTLNEVLELGDVAQRVMRYETAVCISDCKQMQGKVIIKGDLLLKATWL
jgi:hypothetical protein